MALRDTYLVLTTTQEVALGETAERTLVLDPPSSSDWDEAIEEDILKAKNAIGDNTTLELVSSASEPMINFEFPRWTVELMALCLGFRVETAAGTATYAESFRVPSSAPYTIPAKPANRWGGGVAADSGVVHFLNGDRVSESGTVTTAAAAPAASGEVQVLAGAGFVFHPSDANRLFTFTAPTPVANLTAMTDDPFNIFKMQLNFVLQLDGIRTAGALKFDRAQVYRQDSAKVNFAETPKLTLKSLDRTCAPNLEFYGVPVAC